VAVDLAEPLVAPSKDHKGENFPVASRLISPRLRAPVLAFYKFVRAADDIADSPDLAAEDKLRRLDAMQAALLAGDPALPVAARLAEAGRQHGAGVAEAQLLLDAFRQDAVKGRYDDWADLLRYCERSANPVGHVLLRLHRADPAAEAPSDALCTALQILNHLQDLVPDRDQLDRIYVPVPWMERAGGEAAFFDPERAAERREVLDAMLDRVDDLVDEAEQLPSLVRDRRFAAECAVIVALARRLAARLRAGDPVTGRVAISSADFAATFAESVARAASRRFRQDSAIAREKVSRSGSSFKLGMASLPGERRRAIHAVYAYCRVIDDIADGAAPVAEKLRFLADWRAEIRNLGRAATPIGRELGRAAERFALPRSELLELLDGMETDSADRLRLPDEEALDLYCRRVAGAVGVLSIHIFGVPEAQDFACGLGRTLQLTNILRDIDEDAARERVYVPLSMLSRLGLSDAPAGELVREPAFVTACDELAERAAAGFAAADEALKDLDRRRLKPAILMMEAYRGIFGRLQARGWATRGERPRLTRGEKLRLAWLALGGIR